MAARIAPKVGYDTEPKDKYRNDVWNAFHAGVTDIIADASGTLKAVIMPSSEGLEIKVALDRGLRQDQIVCVDRSSAVIATSEWRKKWPGVKFFAAEISEVGDKIRKAGWSVRVANLDLCGNFSESTIEAVQGFLQRAPFSAFTHVAITLAKGRESSALSMLLKKNGADMSAGDSRMECLIELLKGELPELTPLSCEASGDYTSGRVPMTWAVFSACHLPSINALVKREEVAQVETAGVTPSGQYVAAKWVCDRFGISDMTLWRWLKDPKLNFPRPHRLGSRRYFLPSEIEHWERSRRY